MTSASKKALITTVVVASCFAFVYLQGTETPGDTAVLLPEIRMGGNFVDTVIVGSGYNELGAEVVVNGVCTPASRTGTVNTTVPGVYLIDYDFRDSLGHASATITRTVHVIEKEIPILNPKGQL